VRCVPELEGAEGRPYTLGLKEPALALPAADDLVCHDAVRPVRTSLQPSLLLLRPGKETSESVSMRVPVPDPLMEVARRKWLDRAIPPSLRPLRVVPSPLTLAHYACQHLITLIANVGKARMDPVLSALHPRNGSLTAESASGSVEDEDQ
jgi:hypothetical protein